MLHHIWSCRNEQSRRSPRTYWTSAIAVSAALLSTGCFSPSNSYVRVVNASPGLTNFTVQASVINIVSNLPYGIEGVQQEGQYSGPADSSGDYRPVGAGTSQSIVVTQGTSTLATATQTLLLNGTYTVVLTNVPSHLGVLVTTDDESAPQSGDFKWRLVDVASTTGPIDIYLTPLGGSINGATPIVSNLAFGQVTSSYFQLAPGTDEIQVTQHGNTATTLQTATFTPTGGNIYTTYFLDPASSSGTFGFLTTHDPIAQPGSAPPIAPLP